MKFGSPEFFKWLLLLLPLIVLLIGLHRQRAARLTQLISAKVWSTVIPRYSPRRSRVRTALRIFALLCIGLALTRPQWGFKWEEVRQRGLDIIVVLDTSKSMLATDIKPNRLQQAQWAVRDFVRHLKGDRIGLIAFAGSSFLQCPTTIDYAAFTMMLNDLYAGIIPRGGTAISQALETAADSFDSSSEADRVIILITDGEDHEGDPLNMVEMLKKENIRLYSIGVGTPDGELIPAAGGGYVKDQNGQMVKSTINEGLLEQIARETGGFYVRSAPGDFGLDRIYNLGISNLQRDEQETRLAKIHEERFGWFAGAALLLLLAEGLLRAPKASLLLLMLFCFTNLSQAETTDPEDAVATFNNACKQYRENNFNDSEKLFRDVIAQTDDTKLKQKAYYNQGTTLLNAVKSGDNTNKLDAVAQAIDLFELSLELNPADIDSKKNLERALFWMVSGRIKESTRLIDEADQILSQNEAKSAKENYEEAKKMLSPILEDFAPDHKDVISLINRADEKNQMLERAIIETKIQLDLARLAIDHFEYVRASQLIKPNTPHCIWALDLDENLQQEFQQFLESNSQVLNIFNPGTQNK